MPHTHRAVGTIHGQMNHTAEAIPDMVGTSCPVWKQPLQKYVRHCYGTMTVVPLLADGGPTNPVFFGKRSTKHS